MQNRLQLFNEMDTSLARRDAECRKLRGALEAIREMTEKRSRVNMPDGESLNSFVRRALL